jgi:glycosyltransferase involved in cell wall biosynthesis
VCISRAVADELVDWLNATQPARARPLAIGHFPLGSTFADTLPTRGVPADADSLLERAGARSTFLMVGTVEPRKAHREVLAAFERLWRTGVDVTLVIVGKEGWMSDSLATQLRSHPEQGRRLFWLDSIADEMLDRLYAASVALIAASRGEGFGLPLVEAARHGLPVIARDIPVFREVAGVHARFFVVDAPEQLAETLRGWLEDSRHGKVPDSRAIEVLDWAQSTARLCNVVLGGNWYRRWAPGVVDVSDIVPSSGPIPETKSDDSALARPAA